MSVLVALLAVALGSAALGLACDARQVPQATERDGSAPRSEVLHDGGAPVDARPVGDGAATPPIDVPAPADGAHPLDHLDDGALEARLLEDPESLGPVSLGRPELGSMMNAVQMPYSDRWQIVEPHQAWGTQETIDSIIRGIDVVHEVHGGAPPLYVGDISRKRGGYIHPHQGHQSGREVDLGFYYSSPKRWYWKAWRSNLDLPRTWTFIKGLITETDVELIYCDRYVIRLLLEHAKATGEDQQWVRRVFGWRQESKSRPLVRHVPGHRTHIHVRFQTPVARRSGQRLFPILRKHRLLRHPELLVKHRVAAGETIKSIARQYKTSQRAIRRVNELSKNELTEGETYLVPHRVKLEQNRDPIDVPERILPPG